MKRIALSLTAILLVAFPLFSQNGNVAEAAEIHSLDTYDQAIYFETFSVQDSILLDSVYYFQWDEAINDWTSDCCFEDHARTIFIYDENGNLILEIPHHWNSDTNEWYECSVRGYAYDENGNRILETHLHLDETTNERVVGSKTEFTYDENGNRTSSAHLSWNETTLDWVGSQKYEFGYDENGNKTFEIEYHWYNPPRKDWLEFRKHEYGYDGNGNRVLEAEFDWRSAEWKLSNKYKYEYTYDENDNIMSKDGYYWSKDSIDWVGSYRLKHEYAYDEDGNILLEFDYSWNNSTNEWQENEKHEYVYDENGNKTQECHYPRVSAWGKQEYTYDENLIQEITFEWDKTTEDWRAWLKVERYYSNHNQTTQISKYVQNTSPLRIYPNPIDDLLTIELENPDYYTINITTLNGQQIQIGEIEGTSHHIDLSSFQKGVYFITIRSKDLVTTRKIIKL